MVRDFCRIALEDQLSVGENEHTAGKSEDQVHVMLDHQNRNIRRQSVDRLDDLGRLLRRHPCRGLVQEQDLRLKSKPNCQGAMAESG
ncbi:hypothetical protein ACVIU7_006690 [Bradyrhizobium liaoningense]